MIHSTSAFNKKVFQKPGYSISQKNASEFIILVKSIFHWLIDWISHQIYQLQSWIHITRRLFVNMQTISHSYSVVNLKFSKSIYSSLHRAHHYLLRIRRNFFFTTSKKIFKNNTFNYYQIPYSHGTIITSHC